MPDPVLHFELQSTMADQLHGFYSELFGWKIDADNPMNYGIVDTRAGRGINGGIGPAMGTPNIVTFYVGVDNVAAALKKAEALGAKTLMPESDVMPGLKIGIFADPEGNIIGVLRGETDLPENQRGPSAGDGKPVTWFEIGGNDPKALHAFYSALFGWDIHADNEMGYGEVHATEGIGGGIGPTREGPYVTWYVELDDIEGALERIAKLGGKPLSEPMQVSNVTVAQFLDPQGNRIGLYKQNA